MCMNVLSVMHVFYLHDCVGDQKKALDPLKLELEIVVSCCVGAEG